MANRNPRFNQHEIKRIQEVVDNISKKMDESGIYVNGGDFMDLQLDFSFQAMNSLISVVKTNYCSFNMSNTSGEVIKFGQL